MTGSLRVVYPPELGAKMKSAVCSPSDLAMPPMLWPPGGGGAFRWEPHLGVLRVEAGWDWAGWDESAGAGGLASWAKVVAALSVMRATKRRGAPAARGRGTWRSVVLGPVTP